jgi:16S rRNA (cytidine1402-2'-O)-methyltransferase
MINNNINNKSGNLYIVATPIGNLDDITIRALDILRTVDYIAAEDTLHSKNLLRHFGINKYRLISLHNFNEKQKSSALLKLLQKNYSIALISDAGTPLISDPGYCLVKLVRDAGINIIPIPGPCAAITALCASGLPTDRFIFEGFLPTKIKARDLKLSSLKTEARTMIYYEAPHRILSTIAAMLKVFGENREVVIARELTKKFESIYSGKLSDIETWLKSDINNKKGEMVILVHGDKQPDRSDNYINNKYNKYKELLDILASELPPNQVAKLAAKITGINKNILYKQLLSR